MDVSESRAAASVFRYRSVPRSVTCSWTDLSIVVRVILTDSMWAAASTTPLPSVLTVPIRLLTLYRNDDPRTGQVNLARR